jgi:hypothetical protein
LPCRAAHWAWRCAAASQRALVNSSSTRRPPAAACTPGDRLQRHPHHARR